MVTRNPTHIPNRHNPAALAQVKREYIIQGSVIDRATKRGVRGVRVEAWDRDTRYHDLLGQVITDANGAFAMAFDSNYFGDYAPDRAPDLFFRLYLDEREILNTYEQPQRNLQKGITRVQLEIDMPGIQVQGRDWVSAEQTLKAIDWWQASDFRGVWRQGKDKTNTMGKFVGALVSDRVKNFDLKPVVPKSPPERDIVGQNQDAARAALAKQQVEVSDVKSVNDLHTNANLKTFTAYPARLKPGDHVTLYQDDSGLIKYYTLNEPAKAADAQTLERIDHDVQSVKNRVAEVEVLRNDVQEAKTANNELAAARSEDAAKLSAQVAEMKKLKLELDTLRQSNASKEATITQLKTDLTQVRAAQDALANKVGADRIKALELAVAKLTREGRGTPTPTPIPIPIDRPIPARKVAKKVGAKKATAKTASTKTATKAAAKKPAAKKTSAARKSK